MAVVVVDISVFLKINKTMGYQPIQDFEYTSGRIQLDKYEQCELCGELTKEHHMIKINRQIIKVCDICRKDLNYRKHPSLTKPILAPNIIRKR